jgi:Aspartyl protease
MNGDIMELEDLFIWVHALQSRTLYISNWNSMNIPFVFESVHGTANEKALLDSGATECFLDEQMVSRLGIGTKQLPTPRKVHNVDGTENQSGTITEYCSLQI